MLRYDSSLRTRFFQSVILGFVGTLVVIYLPVINDKVFLHAPISWEVRIFIGFLSI